MEKSNNIIILGSTGSIGKQALEIIKNNKSFKAVGLSANKSIDLLNEQAKINNIEKVAVTNEEYAQKLENSSPLFKITKGNKSIIDLIRNEESDTILNALVGSAGLEATIETIKLGKKLALANKESMVAGGEIIKNMKNKDTIIPVDSEHSAVFQLLIGETIEEVESIILTSSGGPFRKKSKDEIKKATVEQALKHPRWDMGSKITIDSATLMNKGLEVIEAHYLFNIPYEKIKVVVHPESIIHSMVQFKDGSVKAHLGQTDMRIPIQYAFSYPHRLNSPLPMLDWGKDITNLNFEKVDNEKFPALKLAYLAGKKGKTYPAALNAANEEAVAAFLNKSISLSDISLIVEKVIDKHEPLDAKDIKQVKEADRWGKQKAKELIKGI